MKARVRITPTRMERLIMGKALIYTVPTGVTELEITLGDGTDIFAKFEAVFDKLWKKISSVVEKSTLRS